MKNLFIHIYILKKLFEKIIIIIYDPIFISLLLIYFFIL
jgi:hypothetical protein